MNSASRQAAAAHLDLMSVFDAREPQPGHGRVEKIVYQPGSSSTPISTKPAPTTSAIRSSSRVGVRIAVVQIAGLIARRIVCFVREQQRSARRRFGMIRFGSRLDVYLRGTPPLVRPATRRRRDRTPICAGRTQDRVYRAG